MALFKILKGPEKKDAAGKSIMLDPTASGLKINEGWAYVTEEGNFYVDFSEDKRLHINAHSITSDFATNDSNGDKICETYIGEIKYMIKSEVPYLQYYFGGPDDRISATPVAMPVASTSSGGVVSTGAQSFKGTKTFTNDIIIKHGTVNTMTNTSTNPYLKFANSDDSQSAMIMFTDYDSYRAPAGLKILGAGAGAPAWLEVEGDFIVGRNTTLNGDLTIKGNLLPATNNIYTLGSDTYKWKELYTTTAYINETIYINKSQDGSKGGISLYGTSAPTTYGIAMRKDFGTHGYATDAWNTYFSMTEGDQKGWIFRNENDSAVASINGQGYAQLNKLCLNRAGNKAYGRISWYSSTYKTWHDYMSSNGSGECPSGGTPSSLGAVKTWALRSYIENSSGYGWIWESAAETNTGTPTPRMALSSYDGKLYLSNDLNIIMGDTDKFVHYLYDSTATSCIGASWRAGVLGSGTGNENYYVIQSGTSTTNPAPTTWNNAVRIGQNEYDFTIGTSTKGSIGIANTTSTTGNGISLYGGAVIGKPTYGLFFGGTNSFGKHGGVQGDWATYFTMDSGTNRGWIFLRGDTAVASISNTGITKVGNSTDATAVDTGALRIAGGLSTTHKSYFGHDVTFKGNNLNYHGSNATNSMIRFLDNTGDAYGNGISIGGGGVVILGSGESATGMESLIGAAGTETTYITSDGSIEFHSNCNTIANRVSMVFDTSRNLYPNANDTGSLGTSSLKWKSLYIGTGGANISGIVKLTKGDASTSTSTGTLQVTGGIATTKTSYFGDTIIMPVSAQMLRWTASASDTNSTGRNWYGIGTYTNTSDSSSWLNISNYWGINITTRGHSYLQHNGNVLANTGNASGTVGSGTKPVYVNGGVLTASSSTVGNSNCPVYLNGGTITPCNFKTMQESISHAHKTTIDLSSLDNSKWFPVTGTSLPFFGYNKIKVSVQLNSGTVPSWSTHASGFSCNMELYVTAIGWGTTGGETIVLASSYSFANIDPCGFQQQSYNSMPVLWLRGGGKYFVETDFDCIWTVRTSSYDTYNSNGYVQTVTPTTTHPGIQGINGTIKAGKVYGAVWNDYAEYRNQKEVVEPGYCVASDNNGKIYKTIEKFQACDGIVSDTFGFAIGETENCKTPLAVSGRVLAYCEGDRYDYQAGDTVCAGSNGKVVKMTRKEIQEWPDRIVGIVSEIPEYDTWGSGNVKVNGRIWVKVR